MHKYLKTKLLILFEMFALKPIPAQLATVSIPIIAFKEALCLRCSCGKTGSGRGSGMLVKGFILINGLLLKTAFQYYCCRSLPTGEKNG